MELVEAKKKLPIFVDYDLTLSQIKESENYIMIIITHSLMNGMIKIC